MSSGGRNEKVGDLLINRLLPNEHTIKVGPFVSLGHVYPTVQKTGANAPFLGQQAHPHRGIITLSYLLSGLLEHVDSRQHRGSVQDGGALWMNAGNGIIHDERLSPRTGHPANVLHALQFWITLPAANKQEEAECRFLQSGDIPELELPGEAGTLRVVLGSCGICDSSVRTYLGEFIYHLRLNPKSAYVHTLKGNPEYAAFVPAAEIHVNGEAMGNSCVALFLNDAPAIHLYNPGIAIADAFIFGGGSYGEPVVAEGPFVMNSRKEITQAYNDFFAGKYGQLKFNR